MKKETAIFKLMIFIQMVLIMSIFYVAGAMEFNSWDVNDWGIKMLGITVIHALGTYFCLMICMYLLYTRTDFFKLN